ncbi:MAG: asparagine synthase (glutamine-hydrolyzing) [Proteobacteria bacterium]|nr:asparagine synthase (glutamine-hydrolyzing) [Pseudomonadota bacterium]
MCGIAGVFGGNISSIDYENVLERIGNVIAHRGPDDSGIWFDRDAAVGLVHRRLSILDLSPAGHQPMFSASKRFVMVFNGEIYNHLKLREELEKLGRAPDWRGHADTESLLAAFECWGVEVTLKKTVGMFAIALWDKQDRKLILARDRMGEKPLYYGYIGSILAFGSELKALREIPGFDGKIDRGALALLMRHSYVPAPYSIYQNFFKLPPSTWLEFSVDALRRRDKPVPMAYWSAKEAAFAGTANPFKFNSDVEAINALESELTQSVLGQMMADVPLGAFLSGGVDSSTVVALMQAQSCRPVKTFSIGFNEEGYDESGFAKEVARHLGTEHTELYVSPQEAMGVIPRLSSIFDEPFSDVSQIPTFLVSKLAHQQVTVSLSGDGGDELFCGYNRYFLTARLWRIISHLPVSLRKITASAILGISPYRWDFIYKLVSGFVPKRRRWPLIGDKLHKGATLLKCHDGHSLYRTMISHWMPEDVVLEMSEPDTELTSMSIGGLSSLVEQMMLLDSISYLPDDILTKVDRAAMAVSLETRVPLIDHRVYEFAWRLPMQYKVRNGDSKWLLRQVLYKYIPRELIDRPKMGFGVPIDSWLRGPLRDWAEDLLDESRLKREGFFNPAPIRQRWLEHSRGSRNWQYHLWDVLMFQSWIEHQ